MSNELDKQKMTASQMVDALMQAIDLQTTRMVEKLEFDKTIVCKIEDDTNKAKGEYIVTDGSSSFTAYSEVTTYLTGVRVYVTVPNGNFDNKKIITGRYVDSENSEYYTYKPPFEDYLDMTGNLIKDNLNGDLVANNPTQTEVVLWQQDNFTQGKGYSLLGLKAEFRSWLNQYRATAGTYGLRLDIRSKEQSTSQNEPTYKFYSCVLNTKDMYGNPYNFESFYSQEKTFDISHISEIVSMKLVFFQEQGTFLDNKKKVIPHAGILDKVAHLDMEQQRLKEISSLHIGDFDSVEEYYDTLNEINNKYDEKSKELEELYPVNLFVQNPYISLGYAESDFTQDTVIAMPMNSLTYDATSTKEQNTKTINARWIHFVKDENDKEDIISIDYEDEIPENAEVHWYRYFLQEGLNDELAGNFWSEISTNKNKLSYTFCPDVTSSSEKIKVIIEHPSRDYIKTQRELKITEIERSDKLEDSEKVVKIQEIETDFSYESQVHYYESEVVTFENEKPVANSATVDLIQGLKIVVDPSEEGGLDGNYCIYGMDYKLVNNAEKERLRPLEATYSSLVTGEPKLDKASKITWKIPLTATMIAEPMKGKEFWFEAKEKDENGGYTGGTVKDKSKVYYLYETGERKEWVQDEISDANTLKNKPDTTKATHILIERDGTENYLNEDDPNADLGKLQIETIQYFRIKEYYTQSASNNTVICEVVKNNVTYTTSADLIFGSQGTNGTDYTLSLQFDGEESCIDFAADGSVGVTAFLYDYENNPIEGTNCKFSWYSHSETTQVKKIDISGANDNDMKCTLKINSDYYNNNKTKTEVDYFILQGVVTYGVNGKEVDLTAYLPVPVRYNKEFTLVEAPTTIMYDNNGTNPIYYKNALKIYKHNKSVPFTENIAWTMLVDDIDGQNAGYYPTIRNNANGFQEVLATNSFYSNLDKKVAIVCLNGNKVVWTQPILIAQNRWPSAMLNKWDGTLQIDENQGTILSQMVGAGYKDDQNRFNGVLMGRADIALSKTPTKPSGSNADMKSGDTTGVFGFHEGAPSFGLMDTGKAFFGKAGHGQIWIDGERSTIASGNYINGTDSATGDFAKGQQGMMIDLDDAYIDMQAKGASKAYVKINTTSPYFTIAANVDNTAKTIINVDSSNYYLQTTDYSKDNKTGMHFSLSDKSLIAYGKKKNDGSNGYVKMTANGSPYFQINDGIANLLYAGQSSYYLQTSDYSETNKTGIRFSLSDKTFIAYGKKDSDGTNGFIQMKANGNPYFQINNGARDLFYAGDSEYYLQSSNYQEVEDASGVTTNPGKGFKIDLDQNRMDINKGKISMNKTVTPTKGDPYINSLILNSEAGEYPIRVNSAGNRMFSVSWDGEVFAKKGEIGGWDIKSDGFYSDSGNVYLKSSTTDESPYVFKAGNNFKVTKGGKLYCSAGEIGGAEIDENGRLQISQLYIGGSKISTKSTTMVTDVHYYAGEGVQDEGGYVITGWDGNTLNLKYLTWKQAYIKKEYLTVTVLGTGNTFTSTSAENTADTLVGGKTNTWKPSLINNDNEDTTEK